MPIEQLLLQKIEEKTALYRMGSDKHLLLVISAIDM